MSRCPPKPPTMAAGNDDGAAYHNVVFIDTSLDTHLAMIVIDLKLYPILKIFEELKDAVVYLDAGCTERFKFIGAFPILLEIGVLAVCSSESTSSLDSAIGWNQKSDIQTKVVFFTCRLLSDSHQYILRRLSTHKRVFQCTIYTSLLEASSSIGWTLDPPLMLYKEGSHTTPSPISSRYDGQKRSLNLHHGFTSK